METFKQPKSDLMFVDGDGVPTMIQRISLSTHVDGKTYIDIVLFDGSIMNVLLDFSAYDNVYRTLVDYFNTDYTSVDRQLVESVYDNLIKQLTQYVGKEYTRRTPYSDSNFVRNRKYKKELSGVKQTKGSIVVTFQSGLSVICPIEMTVIEFFKVNPSVVGDKITKMVCL